MALKGSQKISQDRKAPQNVSWLFLRPPGGGVSTLNAVSVLSVFIEWKFLQHLLQITFRGLCVFWGLGYPGFWIDISSPPVLDVWACLTDQGGHSQILRIVVQVSKVEASFRGHCSLEYGRLWAKVSQVDWRDFHRDCVSSPHPLDAMLCRAEVLILLKSILSIISFIINACIVVFKQVLPKHYPKHLDFPLCCDLGVLWLCTLYR